MKISVGEKELLCRKGCAAAEGCSSACCSCWRALLRPKCKLGVAREGHPEGFHIARFPAVVQFIPGSGMETDMELKEVYVVPCSPLLFHSFVFASEGMPVLNCFCFWTWYEGCLKSLVSPQNSE